MAATDNLSGTQFFEPIRADEARGNSRPVSHAEFQRIAGEGHAYLRSLHDNPGGTRGLDLRWDEVTNHAYENSRELWGGGTYNARTGRPLSTKANAYAVTVKHPGQESVRISPTAGPDEFGHAMKEARDRFPQLADRGHHLGVFHDELPSGEKVIDIDPVVVVRRKEHAEQIGAATRNVGGAFHFRSGNGLFPPHVAG